jgi:hypothetical protein
MVDSKKDKENYLRVDAEVEKGNHDSNRLNKIQLC